MRPDHIRHLVLRSLRDSVTLHVDLADWCTESLVSAATAVANAVRGGQKVLVFGNGGSAADAQHLAAEFVGRFVSDRAPLPGLALTTDTSALTAIGNDYGFDHVFSRQLEALGREGDVAIAISTSGSSPNVLTAVQAARTRGLVTIALTSGRQSELARSVDIPVMVPSIDNPRVQECHLLFEHVLCQAVEALLEVSEQPATGDSPHELTAHPDAAQPKVVSWEGLLSEREEWRRQGRIVVWTNGCFDLLHIGHLRSLESARRTGDVLVVGINDDDSARELKGPHRPLVPFAERAAVVAALEVVDRVVAIGETTPERVLSRLQPDVHCKGADYAPPGGKPVPERHIVEKYGGRVEFTPLVPLRSTSALEARIRARADANV